MNKKFFISTLLVFVATMACGFLVHGVLLYDYYAALPNLFRPEADAQQYFPIMLLAHVIMSASLVWIYRQGKSAKPFLTQGLRFGFGMGMFGAVSIYMIFYAVQPMPADLAVKQALFDTLSLMGSGVVLAWSER